MNFDDRLSQHLSDQADDIEVQPESLDAVSGRAQRRKQRNVGLLATVAVFGVLGFVAAAWQATAPSATETATEGLTEASAVEDVNRDATSSQSGAAEGFWGPNGLDLTTATPTAGRSLDLSSASSANAPGGYNVWQHASADGLYFVLSTAPGVTMDESSFDAIRNDTFYTFANDQWKRTTFGDRYVTSLSSSADLLYTVSTGTTSTRDFAVGTSANAGESWEWQAIDLSAQFGSDQQNWPWFNATVSELNGDLLVVVEKHAGPDWDQAIELAKEAGLEIDPSTDEVFFVDEESISIGRGINEQTPCQAARDDYYDNAWSSFEEDPEQFADDPFGPGETPTEEELAQLDAWHLEMNERSNEIEAGLGVHLETVGGCEEFIACHAQELEWRKIQLEQEADVMKEFGFPDPTTSETSPITFDLDDPTQQAFEEAMSEIYENPGWLDSSPECGSILYGGWFDAEMGDGPPGETYTWTELGVTPPDSWAGSRWGYVISDGESRSLGQLWNDEGFLINLRSDGNQWVAQVDETIEPTSPWDDSQEARDFQPTIAIYRSSDGVTWQRSESNGFAFGQASIGDYELGIDWGEGEPSSLARFSNQAGERLTLADLAPELDTEGYFLSSVKSGKFGAVAWASKWNERSPGAIGSIVLYSADGVSWGATQLDGTEITDVIVGDDDAMIFARTGEGESQIYLAR